MTDIDGFIDGVIQKIAELPNRDSPADQPEMMLVTPSEVRRILQDAFIEIAFEVYPVLLEGLEPSTILTAENIG